VYRTSRRVLQLRHVHVNVFLLDEEAAAGWRYLHRRRRAFAAFLLDTPAQLNSKYHCLGNKLNAIQYYCSRSMLPK
jgi:hypothetical protein